MERGWYKKEDEMSEKELSRRRVTRDTAAKKRGEKIINAEPVEVKCRNGEMVTPCGSFVNCDPPPITVVNRVWK